MATSDDSVTGALKRVADELEATKKLLLLMLIKMGATTEEIGLALNVSASTVRNWIPTSKIKKIGLQKIVDQS